jgi:hypothetical protein
MGNNKGDSEMQFHKNAGRSLARLRLHTDEDDTLRMAFANIAEPCQRQPDVFHQARYGARAPFASTLRYIRHAYDACRSSEARKDVVERAVGFFQGCIAHVRAWLDEMPTARREVFEAAQQADCDEDLAEIRFLIEQSPANAMALIEIGRRDRHRSEERERYLMRIVMQATPKGPRGAA